MSLGLYCTVRSIVAIISAWRLIILWSNGRDQGSFRRLRPVISVTFLLCHSGFKQRLFLSCENLHSRLIVCCPRSWPVAFFLCVVLCDTNEREPNELDTNARRLMYLS